MKHNPPTKVHVSKAYPRMLLVWNPHRLHLLHLQNHCFMKEQQKEKKKTIALWWWQSKVCFIKKMVAPIAVSSPKSTLLQNPICFGDSSSSFVGGSLKGLCFNLKRRQQRRELTNLVVASSTSSVTNSNASGRFYFNITGFPFPLGPFLNRRTIRTEVMPSCFVLCLVWMTILITELIWLRLSIHWVAYLWFYVYSDLSLSS